jgi:hypothetical protein
MQIQMSGLSGAQNYWALKLTNVIKPFDDYYTQAVEILHCIPSPSIFQAIFPAGTDIIRKWKRH